LSKSRTKAIAGNKSHKPATITEIHEESSSGIVAIENLATFKNEPNEISRYPSVKNLKKLQKK